MQEWDDSLPEGEKDKFEKSREVCERMKQVYEDKGVDVEILSYVPDDPVNGADAPEELYEEIGNVDIIFMPTVYSLTHTEFKETQRKKGSRIASMPGFTLDLFREGGPMDVNYENMRMMTDSAAHKLRASNYIRVMGEGTDIDVEIDPDKVFVSDGNIKHAGKDDNIPGAEAFCIPVHEGETDGYFTVPKGWGGMDPLEYKAKFIVEQGRIVDIEGETEEAQEYIDEEIKPKVLEGEDHNILAELGIGTNPAVTEEYIEEHGWNLLLAEKVFGSVHFANGNSAAMGGENDVPVHIDWVVPDVDIYFMRDRHP